MTRLTSTRTATRRARIGTAIFIGVVALLMAVVTAPASPAAAITIGQCSSVDDTPGLGMECDVTIVNTLDVGTGVTSSSVTVKECHGFANTDLSASCTEHTTLSTDLVTSVSQCNYAITSGGSLHCSVNIRNDITGVATAVAATVNQCNDSLAGGTVVLRACSPDGLSTTNADITQCNGSDNGGGSSLTCTVEQGSTSDADLVVAINQCNNSANGGGSLIVCTAGIVNNVTAPDSVPAPTGDTGTGTGTGKGADTGTGTVGGANGASANRSGAPGAPESLAKTGTTAPFLPVMGVIVLGAALVAGSQRVRTADSGRH